MAKGDDALAKKKNKAIRKRNRRAGAGTTEAIEGVQSHKRRRKAGTRRVCEAMCYSLPTPEDPFNNRKKFKKQFKERESAEGGEEDDTHAAPNGRVTRTGKQRTEKPVIKGRLEASNGVKGRGGDKESVAAEPLKDGKNGLGEGIASTVKGGGTKKPLKKVVWNPTIDADVTGSDNGDASIVADHAFRSALSAISESEVGRSEQAPPSPDVSEFERQWWQACALGISVLGVSGNASPIRAIVVAAAPHVAAQRYLHSAVREPVALILVNSKERALLVRQTCKPLKKSLNIHSVCLHAGTPVEHQVEGLAVQTPDIVVATPDRLCDLLALHALKLMSVSYVVVDGLDDLTSKGFGEHMDTIRQHLRPGAQVGVLSTTFAAELANATGRWLQDPIARVVPDSSLPACSACISQTVSVVTTEDAKLSKFNKILEQVRKNQEENRVTGSALLLVNSMDQIPTVVGLLLKHGFLPHIVSKSAPAPRGERRLILVAKFDEPIEAAALSDVEVVINYDLSWPVEQYIRILTGMARATARGRIETLCGGAAAWQADSIADTLRRCGQPVPRPLLLLAQAAALLQQ